MLFCAVCFFSIFCVKSLTCVFGEEPVVTLFSIVTSLIQLSELCFECYDSHSKLIRGSKHTYVFFQQNQAHSRAAIKWPFACNVKLTHVVYLFQ